MPLPSISLTNPKLEDDLGRQEFLNWLVDKDWEKLSPWQRSFCNSNFMKSEFTEKQRQIIDQFSFTINHSY